MKKIVYVDMDNVLVDFRSAFPHLSEEIMAEYGDDLDDIPALSLQRERQWEKLVKTDFLTLNEKRQAAGYGALEGGDALPRPRRGGGKRDGEGASSTVSP